MSVASEPEADERVPGRATAWSVAALAAGACLAVGGIALWAALDSGRWWWSLMAVVTTLLGVATSLWLGAMLAAARRDLFERHVRNLQVDQLITLGRLASSIAHEVRNPLHNMGLLMNDLESLGHIDESGQTADVIRRIQANCARIDYAVTLVYRLARPGDLKHRLSESTPYPVVELFEDIEQQMTPDMQHRVVMIPQLSDNVRVRYPKEFLVIIVDNLLRNACQASKDTPVYLEATAEQRSIVVKVLNEGRISKRAMEELTLEEIPTQRVSGLGLGVFIIRHLASQMKLKIEYTCNNDVVTATVRIPLHYAFGML